MKNNKKKSKNKFTVFIKKIDNVHFSLFEMILIIFISIIFGIMIGYYLTYNRRIVFNDVVVSDEVNETYSNILNNYYKKIDKKELDKAAIKGMLSILDDSYSVTLEKDSMDELNEQINGYFCGIGVTATYKENVLKIVNVVDGGPASKAKLLVNDKIVKVNNIEVTENNYSSLIKGTCGKKVILTIERDNKIKEFTIKRDKITIDVVSSHLFEVNDKKIGYIDIDVFSNNSYTQFLAQLNDLESKDIDSLVIDLRDNPGGIVDSAKNILNLFFKKNTVLYKIKSRSENITIKDGTKEYKKYPVVLLMNEGTASSSEIFISCFKDNYKDVITIGKNTYGKSSVQKSQSISSDYGLKYTISEWYTSKGKKISEDGIKPDYYEENGGFSYNEDIQLNKAIELLTK